MKIITREQAKLRGLKKYFTGTKCNNGHLSNRRTANGSCDECVQLSRKKNYDSEKNKIYQKQYYQQNKESLNAQSKQYYQKNIDYFIKYWSDNAGMYNANSAKRRSLIKQAIPTWANIDMIQKIYDKCASTTNETGIRHNVDHIVPLQGKNVCGLHCEDNLQILTETANKQKGNKLNPHIPGGLLTP
jgi:5-methylcytosine-specific restriction endonuclease McrA